MIFMDLSPTVALSWRTFEPCLVSPGGLRESQIRLLFIMFWASFAVWRRGMQFGAGGCSLAPGDAVWRRVMQFGAGGCSLAPGLTDL